MESEERLYSEYPSNEDPQDSSQNLLTFQNNFDSIPPQGNPEGQFKTFFYLVIRYFSINVGKKVA